MIPLVEARARVLARCPGPRPVSLPLADALGTVLAEAVVAGEPVPPFDNTAVDGFAVRSVDTTGATDAAPARLRVVATVAAGAVLDGRVGPGEAVRIMTGAPMPPGADGVVMVEDSVVVPTDAGATAGGPAVEEVDLRRPAEPGRHVRRAGEDIVAGTEVLAPGTVLGPALLGVAASVGRQTLTVGAPLRVGVVSTGDELVEDDRPLRPGEIRESNRPMLLALVRLAGCTPVDLGRVPDDEDLLGDVLGRAAADCDAVVSSGGVSMGDFDVVKVVLDRMAAMDWMQVAIRPAKPFAFGLVDGTPVFGLPGNPVSSLVSFELLARPALRQMMGHRRLDRPTLRAFAAADVRRRPDERVHYVRGQALAVDGRLVFQAVSGQGSHQLAASATANALAIVPDGDGVRAGDPVDVMLLGELPSAEP